MQTLGIHAEIENRPALLGSKPPRKISLEFVD
jgi:hypothetical protein